MTGDRKRCGNCGRTRPEHDTTLVQGKRGGDYRHAARSALRRVCRTCTAEQVDYARRGQAEGRNVPLNTARIRWAQAADHFGISRGDLLPDGFPARRLP
jgi:hypothetical protein